MFGNFLFYLECNLLEDKDYSIFIYCIPYKTSHFGWTQTVVLSLYSHLGFHTDLTV